ncbi:putative 2OG-Fe(II) oxygenase [Erythrobacter sp. SDW2]|uniref:tetratricopeptide repeat protein n=1 Tax=Erythrobacter sp. SDW2 TaxID=2907154 RepID=UPI001F3090F3|nr:tetratricopeptide repeat protein [Erythrobacter sp. SDW2]UIP06550.1 putative 2OG-Fe(II) oxygenase [Erythrobacter sp. SDW2]
MSKTPPESWHARAVALERGGDPAGAKSLLEQALAEHPGHAELLNSAGNLAMRRGEQLEAASLFQAALAAKPGSLDFALNLAIALTGAGRAGDAVRVLVPFEDLGAQQPRYCSARAAAERAAGRPGAAARWYDVCLRLDPNHQRALHGRARTAIERGEPGALARVDAALAANPAEADLWLARAQALDVAGDAAGAREIAEQLVEQAPQWLEGLRFLAQLRHAAGEKNWASHYAMAAQKVPRDATIAADHIAVLAGLDFAAEAAEVAAAAQARFPAMEQFALLEAVNAGFAGDDARAEAIFADLSVQGADRWLQEARHRIRQGDAESALAALDKALSERPWDIAAWALRGIGWRMAGDDRAAWLHEQEGLVSLLPLSDADAILPPAIERLHTLHDRSPMPLGQSLRGGSQTRGILFHRLEPEFARLQQAILRTVEDYRGRLPGADSSHPLLRHREASWQMLGSWSVRLHGGGDHHAAHIHPQGILSSACYLILPEGRGARDGALEIGRPAPDLRVDLGPVRVIEPQVGHLALFPSTLYHGTTPFGEGRRMTVAFDVVTGNDAHA